MGKETPPTLLVRVNISCHYQKQTLRKVKIELPYSPRIPLLGIYLYKLEYKMILASLCS